MAADPTDLSFLVFVIVATNPTWILPLPLPHILKQRLGQDPDEKNAAKSENNKDPDQETQ